jgi:solute carrier family 25 (mitochondrial carnitine/acylcarnitine transporter), member 20/29
MEKEPSLLKTTISGGCGGASLVCIGHPLDTIKVRMQTMNQSIYKNTIDCARKIIRDEGIRGLYLGIKAPLLGVTPMYAVSFLGYSVGKSIFLNEDSMEKMELGRIGMAGAFSAWCTLPFWAPLERIKCLLQIQQQNLKSQGSPEIKYPGGVFDTARRIFAEGGVRAIYRGAQATLVRDSLASFIYFSSYEFYKQKISLFRYDNDTKSLPPSSVALLAGGLTGITTWIICLPADTIKSRLQVSTKEKYPNGLRSVLREAVQLGLPSLYRGFGAVMTRAFPANAAAFFGFETSLRFLTSIGLE